jgi:acyl-CoA reductase-like NAD-dependent aldehyde dehydrogenase
MAYATINPATGEQLATFPRHTAVEVEAALTTAQKAYGKAVYPQSETRFPRKPR